jgi:hypothetical protein
LTWACAAAVRKIQAASAADKQCGDRGGIHLSLKRLGNPALGASELAARGDRSAAGEAAVFNVERGFSGMQFIEKFVPRVRIRIRPSGEYLFFICVRRGQFADK